MRYFDIRIDPASNATDQYGNVTVHASKGLRFQTHPNGLQKPPDMGALHVTFDLPITSFDAPNGSAFVQVQGIDIVTVSQASNLQGAQITISGGMGKGLPLAKPDQAGVLLFGSVWQAFGNWVDTNMSLGLVVQPYSEPTDSETFPKFVWHWQKGIDITQAIKKAITTAMPGYTCDFWGVTRSITAGSDDAGFYPDIQSLAQLIMSVSKSAVNDSTYQGIRFYVSGKKFYFYDGSNPKTPKQIQFEDMIGQPTWLGPADFPSIIFQTTMRADISLGDTITLPKFNQSGSKTVSGYGSIAASQAAGQTPKNRALFQGNFTVTSVRHIGDSRNPSGDAWITVFEAVKQ